MSETFKHAGMTVLIEQDDDPVNPREWDNMGIMVYWHRNYNLGDVDGMKEYGDSSEFFRHLAIEADEKGMERIDERVDAGMDALNPKHADYKARLAGIREAYRARLDAILEKNYVMLPLALLDHSGLHMWVGSRAHGCDPGGWDSGQVGWIYCSLEKAQEEFKSANKRKGWDAKVKWNEGKTITLREAVENNLTSEVETYDQMLTGDVWGYVIKGPNGEDLDKVGDSCWGFYGHSYCIEEAKEAAESCAESLAELQYETAVAECMP
jgi:hypothetical protein